MAYCIYKSYKLKNILPLEIFASLKERQHCFFLDSSLNHLDPLGRYSFFGVEPFYIFHSKNQNPFAKLRALLGQYQIALPKIPLPFIGGAVGYLAYDLGFMLERKLQKRTADDLGLPDCLFAFYNTILAIDHLQKRLDILATGFPERRRHLAKLLCQENLRKMEGLLKKIRPQPYLARRLDKKDSCLLPKSNFTRKQYFAAVRKAKDYISQGDIYQVNLAQRFQAQTTLSAFEIYRRLRRLSPAYFSAYQDCGDFQILSSSPERFLRLSGDRVVTRPMKGTRPRGASKGRDGELKEELLGSLKDKAELMMITDLERNDLGRVCDYHSIKVTDLRQLEKYATVFQTTATIEGRLHRDKDRMDLLHGCFPGGSVTGCPKIRAMEVIEELEPTRRSLYTGALGYLSFCGNMDFNILIRTILKKKNDLYFAVGGGIVADSLPQAEYQETLVKAKGILQAIGSR